MVFAYRKPCTFFLQLPNPAVISWEGKRGEYKTLQAAYSSIANQFFHEGVTAVAKQ
jgi:hypothetical protein